MSSLVCLKAWTVSLIFLFTEDLTVTSSATVYLVVLVEEGLGLIWENLVWMLSADFISLFLLVWSLLTQSLLCLCWQ